MAFISICIPTYEMRGKGARFLIESFEKLKIQTYTDFDVVISDHSLDDTIQSVCSTYSPYFSITYIRNLEKRGNSSANINNAIRHASGTLIKILFQDDFLYHKDALRDIATTFDLQKSAWLITASIHTKDGRSFFRPFYPFYNNNIHLGNNTISSPSVLTIHSKNILFFDEHLLWLMDCDYYKRCYNSFGKPVIIDSISVVNRVGTHQVSKTLAHTLLKHTEYKYILQKYNQATAWRRSLPYRFFLFLKSQAWKLKTKKY